MADAYNLSPFGAPRPISGTRKWFLDPVSASKRKLNQHPPGKVSAKGYQAKILSVLDAATIQRVVAFKKQLDINSCRTRQLLKCISITQEGFTMIMFELFPNRCLWLAAVLSCSSIVTGSALASDDDGEREQHTRTVNCLDGHQSVQSAIDRVRGGQDATIFVVGFCDESVSIAKDGITLSGNKPGYGVNGDGLSEVKVTGAQRVIIEYLELTGPGYGVLAEEGASVTIRHNNIHDNMASGVGVFNQAFARVDFNTITQNGLRGEDESGIDGSGGVTIRSAGNYIAENNYAAIASGNTSFFRSQSSGEDTDDRDIFLQKGCSEGDLAGTCGVEGTLAVDCFKNALCDFRNTEVTGGIEISSMSNLEARNSTINGNIDGFGGSRLALRNTVNSGSVSCGEATIALYFNPCGQSFSPGP